MKRKLLDLAIGLLAVALAALLGLLACGPH
jgi:hypothetical protein